MGSPDSDFFQNVDLSAMEAEQPDVLDQLMASGSTPWTESDRSRSDRRINTVDGQIIQTLHPWVVGYPLSPKISTLWFRIFVPDLSVWFISSIRRSEPNQKKNIVIGGAGGLLDYKGLKWFE